MTRLQWGLAGLIVLELAGGGLLLFTWPRQSAPLPPDFSLVDSVTERELRDVAAACRIHEAADWRRLANLYLAFGYAPEAASCYQRAARLAPEHAETRYEWAFALTRSGRVEESTEQFHQALRRGHARPRDCWFFIGRNHLRQGEVAEAQAAFRRAGELPRARYELAKSYLRQEQLQRAAPLLDSLLEDHPQSFQAEWLRARIHESQGNPQAAAALHDKVDRSVSRLPTPFDREFQRLYEIHDQFGISKQWLQCEELMVSGHSQSAAESMTDLLEQQWNPKAAEALAEMALREGDGARAIELLKQLIAREGPSFDSLRRLGDLYEALGQSDEAESAWLRAARLAAGQPDAPALHKKLAGHFQRRGRIELARRHEAWSSFFEGVQLYRNGKFVSASESLKKALQVAPGHDHAWYYLGEAQRQLKAPLAARRAYQRCLEINPDHGRAIAALSLLPDPPAPQGSATPEPNS